MKILVTGGLGFIGSHTAVELAAEGHELLLIDDLSNSSMTVKENIEKITEKELTFRKVDLRNKNSVLDLFDEFQDIGAIIHFAASKSVTESLIDPLLYYENNIGSLVNLLIAVNKHGIKNFIFSSSCTVYGQAEEMPISEETPLKKAESPYGNTKKIGEEIIIDLTKASSMKAVLLRYFNPIGAHESGHIGELPLGAPQNLIPYLTQTAAGIRKELSVFGGDYNTADGTAVRDYIHVVDLAKAHVAALDRILNNRNTDSVEVFNLGTGTGNSVLDVIQAFQNATNVNVPHRIVARRPGDIMVAYTNTDKANSVLNWKAQSSLEHSLLTAWNWEKKIRNLNNLMLAER